MFIEVTDRKDGYKVLININSIAALMPIESMSMSTILLVNEKTLQCRESYEEVKARIQKRLSS